MIERSVASLLSKVENRIKAKKQTERRLQQKVNNANQRKHTATESTENDQEYKRRSRGASQRAKKRQKKETMDDKDKQMVE